MPEGTNPNPPKTLGHSAHRDRTTRSAMGQAAFLPHRTESPLEIYKQKKAVDLPQEGFVRLPTILEVLPVSRSHWWQMVKDGRAPKGIKISSRITMWDVRAIRKLLAEIGGELE